MIIVLKVSTTEKYQEGYSYHEKTENVANRSSCDLLSHRHLCMDLSGLEEKQAKAGRGCGCCRPPGSKRTGRCGASGSVARRAGSAGNVEIQGCRRDVQKRGREKPSNAFRKLHFGDAPFNSDEGVDITIERGEYQGEPAFSVFAEGHQVGNISKDDVPFFVRRWSDFVGVTSAEVYGGGTDDEGHSINYGMKINCEFRKQA
jgi:hypothetical protein